MYLRRLNYQTSVERFLPLLDNVSWDVDGRCALNKPKGHWLYDSYEFLPEWQGTEFEKFAGEIPHKVSELRLIKLDPGECYRSHADIDDRLHINLVASDQCFLVNLNDQKLHKIETDGYLYKMDGSYLHSAVNLGGTVRIQLVMRIPLTKYDIPNGKTVTIEFTNPPYNLRYVVDQYISPFLNTYVKQGLLGYFDAPSVTKFTMHIDDRALTTIRNKLDNLKLEYKI